MNYHKIKLSFLLLGYFFLFTLFSNAQITVDNLADGPANAGNCEIDAPPVGGNCSLRDAVEAANGNAGADEIIFDGGLALPGTIALTEGQMIITDDLTITGPGANMLEIDADNSSRIFLVDDSTVDLINVEIFGLTFFDGFSSDFDSGAAIFNNETLTVDSCDFNNNDGDGGGGAIFNEQGSFLNVRNSNFNRNSANNNAVSTGGGAIANDGTINEILNSNFTGNNVQFGFSAPRGGAILNFGIIGDIIGCLFENNSANSMMAGLGGAINNTDFIDTIVDTQFISNTAFGAGGAILNNNTINLIDNSLFDGNSTADTTSAFANGGAISVGSGIIGEIKNSTFNNNSASNGGAINTRGQDFGTEFPSEITNINNTTFSRNTARVFGGAIIFNQTSSTSNIINSTFTLNTAMNEGGAIYFGEEPDSVDPINISFTTIVNNSSGLASNLNRSDVYTIRNSVVADNNGANCDTNYTDLASEINNYSDDASCGFDFSNDATITVGNLLNNGGPTDTVILGGNPIDGASAMCDPLNTGGSATGIALTTDQRLFTRPVNVICDSGAVENGAAPETVTINLTKVTNPQGGLGFDFTSTNFDSLSGCMIDDTFTMDHNDTFTCDIPVGDYTIDEDIPGDQELQIVCNEGPNNLIVNNMTGETNFSVIGPNDNINCVYINSSPDFLSLVTDEPPGANCFFGGVRVDTGFDDNFDGMLDPGEIDDTQFFCNTAIQTDPPPQTPQPPTTGDDDDDNNNDDLESLVDINVEPAGVNCPNGGVRVDTGIDDNEDGILQANEIDDTNFICDDPPGSTNNNNNGDSDSGCSLAESNSSNKISLFSALLPLLMIPFVVFRRKKRGDL